MIFLLRQKCTEKRVPAFHPTQRPLLQNRSQESKHLPCSPWPDDEKWLQNSGTLGTPKQLLTGCWFPQIWSKYGQNRFGPFAFPCNFLLCLFRVGICKVLVNVKPHTLHGISNFSPFNFLTGAKRISVRVSHVSKVVQNRLILDVRVAGQKPSKDPKHCLFTY